MCLPRSLAQAKNQRGIRWPKARRRGSALRERCALVKVIDDGRYRALDQDKHPLEGLCADYQRQNVGRSAIVARTRMVKSANASPLSGPSLRPIKAIQWPPVVKAAGEIDVIQGERVVDIAKERWVLVAGDGEIGDRLI